ncbi:hypothetical protein ACTL32_04865 [Planococcus sp. FY231025]|uniref:hypothetical protein n=1 Tax=Planococcus sp. FY231025 TaxID=3455699 RepID=UPI003F913E8D
MTGQIERVAARKFLATFFSVFIMFMAWSTWSIAVSDDVVYETGTEFSGMTFVFFLYIGMFVLIYGNLVSLAIEALQRKWFEGADWAYVLILGGFGAAIGLLFPIPHFVFIGVLTAVLYGIIDKWLLKRQVQEKANKAFCIAPFLVFLLLWGYFQNASAALPPYTAAEAIGFATSGEGTPIDRFPTEAGTWEGQVEGYQVRRTTAAEKVDDGVFEVIFKEDWETDAAAGSWMMSYIVDRESSMFHREEGVIPPYER